MRAFFPSVCLAVLTTAAALAQPSTEDRFFFLQMSDPQFGMNAKDRDFVQETTNYEFAIATANRLKPRFVIVCGDLVNKAGDTAQIAEYLRITAKLDRSIRVYNVPGNHDVDNEPAPQTIKAYRDRFGPDYYGFREGGLYGIVLNSTLIHSPQNAMDAFNSQNDWLAKELKKAKASGARHIVVFQHHPFFLARADEPDQYFNIPLARRKRLLGMFHAAGIEYIFAGHYHRNSHGMDGNLEMVTTGPVSMPIGDARVGFRAVWVNPKEIRHEYYDFGRIPNLAVEPSTK